MDRGLKKEVGGVDVVGDGGKIMTFFFSIIFSKVWMFLPINDFGVNVLELWKFVVT